MAFNKKHFVSFLKQITIIYSIYKYLYSIYKYISLRKYRIIENNILLELRNLETKTSLEICKQQESKLLELLSYANNNCKYYNKLFDDNKIDISKIESLSNIPILTKDIIREKSNEIISKQFYSMSLQKRNTGGSTGEPLEFFADPKSGSIDNAHHRYLYSLMGYKKGDIIVDSGGTFIPLDLRNKNIFWLKKGKNNVWGHYEFSVLYISDMNIKYYVEKLILLKPAILRGYPSFFNKLATFVLNNKITFNFKIKGINLTAEMCSDEQLKNIEKAFSTQVYFEYGHSEMCVYCYTKNISHIYSSSPIYGYIEIIKDDGMPAEIGEVGNVIATGFCNYAMPFIRYQTGDKIRLLHREGGVVEFKEIHGRNQDYILSKSNQKIYLTALIFGQHLKAFRNIKQWQFIQDRIGIVKIAIIKDTNYTIDDEKEIRNKIISVSDLDLIIEYVESIPLTKRGKQLFLVQNVKGIE